MAAQSPQHPQSGFAPPPSSAAAGTAASSNATILNSFPSTNRPSSISGSTIVAPSIASTSTAVSGSTTAASSSAIPSSQDYLRDLFQKRLHSFTYLKRTLSSRQAWFNTVTMNQDDLSVAFDHERMKKRTIRFTLLGLSLSSILELTTPADMARAIVSLINELDSHPDDTIGSLVGGTGATAFGTAKPKMKNFFKSSTKTLKRSAASQALSDFSSLDGASGSAGMGAGLSMSMGGAGGGSSIGGLDRDYSYLVTPNVPFQLDFFQTFFSLCDILSEIYHKLISFMYSPSTGSGAGPINVAAYVQNDMGYGSYSGATSTIGSVNGGVIMSSPTYPPPTMERDRSTSLGTAASESSAWAGPGLSPSYEGASPDKAAPIGQVAQDLLLKADSKVKKMLNQQVKEIDSLARQLIKDELSSLDPLMKELGLPAQANSAFLHHPNGSYVSPSSYSSSPGSSGLPADYGSGISSLPFSLSRSQGGSAGSFTPPNQSATSRKASVGAIQTGMQGSVAQRKQMFSHPNNGGAGGTFASGHHALQTPPSTGGSSGVASTRTPSSIGGTSEEAQQKDAGTISGLGGLI